MRADYPAFRAAQDSLRLRIGASLLSLVILSTLVAGLRPSF